MPFPFSFELFPPRTAKVAERMPEITRVLGEAGPEFISVTFGAGGSSRDASLDVLRQIRRNGDARPLAHLTCVGSSEAEAGAIIDRFIENGILDFLALRGDPPKGLAETDEFLGDLRSGAELTEFIRRRRDARRTPGEEPLLVVAAYPNGHPQSRSIEQDYDALLAKQAAGANLAITQLFFEAEDYLRFVEGARARGVAMPIMPGVMPITSVARLQRMAELAGEAVPERWRRSLDACRSDRARRELGIAHAAAMSHDLLEGGAPGIHVYTHNRTDEPLELLSRLGAISPADASVEPVAA
ncbi:methylenetetrahydrofolate reductase [Gulosibacter sp. 10]|uniref:methylenetetrahydrofolate reductase n=1 Tax=Gulosibacter sp. 10 TaxID=1255570 RepID=UPI00097F4127|nr:methylenetetrahydrofolate reductase [Gulosibacter sp. 10]SJM49993.1 5,10-methylenetetrahydrofolate reductase [Gulosibacter sp. 10]